MAHDPEDLRGPSPWIVAAAFVQRGGSWSSLLFVPKSGRVASIVVLVLFLLSTAADFWPDGSQFGAAAQALKYVAVAIRLLFPFGTDVVYAAMVREGKFQEGISAADAAKQLSGKSRGWRVALWVCTRPYFRVLLAMLMGVCGVFMNIARILGVEGAVVQHAGFEVIRGISCLGFVMAMVLPFVCESASRHRIFG